LKIVKFVFSNYCPCQRRSFNPFPNLHVHDFTRGVARGRGAHGVFCMGWGVRIRSYASVLLPAAWTAQQHRVGREHVNTYDNSFIHSSFKTS